MTYPTPVFFAKTGWDQILPGLYMGGHEYDPIAKWSSFPQLVVVRDEFDVVISLYQGDPGCGPPDNIPHLVYPVPDGPLDDDQRARLRTLATTIAFNVKLGDKRILVRCQAGYNRSGLLVGMVLLRLGYTAAEAIILMREKRSRYALCNDLFVTYLGEEEDRAIDTTRTDAVTRVDPYQECGGRFNRTTGHCDSCSAIDYKRRGQPHGRLPRPAEKDQTRGE